MLKTILAGCLILCAASPASAATYVFDVGYKGGGQAFLAPGSDDPTATTLQAGDQFTYSLSAADGGFWEVIRSGSLFPFFSLGVSNSSIVNFSLNLLNDGSSIFSVAGNAVSNCCAHLGTNQVNVVAGLKYDAYQMTVNILSGGGQGGAFSYLPYYNNGPEQQFSGSISFTPGVAAVPEPDTWAMLILGFGAVGAGMRARRKKMRLAAA